MWEYVYVYDVYVCMWKMVASIIYVCVCVRGMWFVRYPIRVESDSERWQLLVFVFTHSLLLLLVLLTVPPLYDWFQGILYCCQVPATSNLFHLFSFSLPAKTYLCVCVYLRKLITVVRVDGSL